MHSEEPGYFDVRKDQAIKACVLVRLSVPVFVARLFTMTTVYWFQDVLGKVIRTEGFFSLWKGFTPYYARLGKGIHEFLF